MARRSKKLYQSGELLAISRQTPETLEARRAHINLLNSRAGSLKRAAATCRHGEREFIQYARSSPDEHVKKLVEAYDNAKITHAGAAPAGEQICIKLNDLDALAHNLDLDIPRITAAVALVAEQQNTSISKLYTATRKHRVIKTNLEEAVKPMQFNDRKLFFESQGLLPKSGGVTLNQQFGFPSSGPEGSGLPSFESDVVDAEIVEQPKLKESSEEASD